MKKCSLYLYHVGYLNVDLKCSYTLNYIATLFLSPIYLLLGLTGRAIQCKVLLIMSWFAKEANVADNKQRLANDMTQSQRRTGTLQVLRDRK